MEHSLLRNCFCNTKNE